ncbi:DegT/DnrJ/EryC1/StrS family aminotransferase [Halomicrobium sp. IBSBa]|uniref:DegT/DnrJ/EryC1/StrS family aminotransferase n=1 Tax=Halomicrobium sp. IBSBa TaxID=2778916 RepID=UPI001ABF5686|nr:DegT/DnrJ/EryC1/StrS family aminotransferase [Halomicrobium sp. IBSBa]MBO4247104.1 DegT/DnrJ/EryC1/StrS family aminotransferase [Halomicrobium sp. IBSBa]
MRDILSPAASPPSYQDLLLDGTDFSFVLPVQSCRAALVYALEHAGVDGDEVLLPGYTCYAVQSAVEAVGTPVYVDVTEDFAIDIDKAKQKVTNETAAIVPVHPYGLPCDMESVASLAEEHDLTVVEDAAQALGTHLTTNAVGTHSDYCVFSLRFYKDVTVFKGGLVLSEDLPAPNSLNRPTARRTKLLGIWMVDRVLNALPGRVYEPVRRHVLDPVSRDSSAGVPDPAPTTLSKWDRRLLGQQLAALPDRIETRRQHARRYDKLLPDDLKQPNATETHSYFRYPVLVEETRREDLCRALRKRGVGCSPMYAYTIAPDDTCPRAHELSHRVLNLPVHAGISDTRVRRISKLVRNYHKDGNLL